MNQVKIILNVIDDDPIIPDFITDMFQADEAYQVLCFNKPDEFFEQFSKDVDLVITDIRIPGYDVLGTIRTIAAINPTCYIIVMSAYFNVDILKEFIRLRVDGVVEKTHDVNWLQNLKEVVDGLKPKLLQKLRTKL